MTKRIVLLVYRRFWCIVGYLASSDVPRLLLDSAVPERAIGLPVKSEYNEVRSKEILLPKLALNIYQWFTD